MEFERNQVKSRAQANPNPNPNPKQPSTGSSAEAREASVKAVFYRAIQNCPGAKALHGALPSLAAPFPVSNHQLDQECRILMELFPL